MHNTVLEFWNMVVEENYKSIITLSNACAYSKLRLIYCCAIEQSIPRVRRNQYGRSLKMKELQLAITHKQISWETSIVLFFFEKLIFRKRILNFV